MELSTWLLAQYEKWKTESESVRTLADFALYLDVPPTSLSNWINAGSRMRADTVSKISKKLGPEIYDVLGLRRPDEDIYSGIPELLASRLRAASKEIEDMLNSGKFSPNSPEHLEAAKEIFARHGFDLEDIEIKE